VLSELGVTWAELARCSMGGSVLIVYNAIVFSLTSSFEFHVVFASTVNR
jgi:hypothetical protein